MPKQIKKTERGFTLVEAMIAAVIGLIMMLAATAIFRQAMNVVFVVSQRAETQQNMRAAVELMTKDISLAGAGLPTGGLQLPTAGGSSLVACNQSGTCYVPGDVYPANPSTGTTNYMYGILPGYGNGVQNSAVITEAPAPVVNDSITSIYCDYNFPLSNFTFTFGGSPTTTIDTTVNNAAITPNNIQAPGGLQVGDLLLFIVTTAGTGTGNQGTSAVQSGWAVGEITGLPAPVGTSSAQGTIPITFGANDPLNINQVGDLNSLSKLSVGGNTLTVCRLYAVTYFLQVPTAGGTVQTPRLMRQVNGQTAVPVADNIINIQFTYDIFNPNTNTVSPNVANPAAVGLSPNLIQKVNLWVMGQNLLSGNNRSQSMYLASSVSTGNMSFCNGLSSSTSTCGN